MPFEELTLDLFGGPRASVSTPSRVRCATPPKRGFTPWSGTRTGERDLARARTSQSPPACRAAGCPAGAAVHARVRGAEHEPAGGRVHELRAGTLASRRRSGAQRGLDASAAGCRGAALERHAVRGSAGRRRRLPGGKPDRRSDGDRGSGTGTYVQTGGKVYITGPYGGAPFGLEIVTPADRRPVRSRQRDGSLEALSSTRKRRVGHDRSRTRCRRSSGASRCSSNGCS